MKIKRGIPPALEPEVLVQAGKGLSCRAIAEWLYETHQVTVGHASVARLIAIHRDEREAIAKAVTRTELRRTVLSDLDVLARERNRLMKLTTRLYRLAVELLDQVSTGERKMSAAVQATEAYGRASERLQALIGQRMKLAGATTPDDDAAELAEASQRLRSRLDSLALSLGEGAADSGDSAYQA